MSVGVVKSSSVVPFRYDDFCMKRYFNLEISLGYTILIIFLVYFCQ